MVKTNAQIQSDYRNRRKDAWGGEDKRINTWVSYDTKTALDFLCKSSGYTQKDVLEHIILTEHRNYVKRLRENKIERGPRNAGNN